MMKLHSGKFGLAVAIVSAVVWLLVGALMFMRPAGMRGKGGYGPMMNGDVAMYEGYGHMGWGAVLAGLIVWPIVAGLSAWATAAIYNRLLG